MKLLNNLENSVKIEIANHIIDKINDGIIDDSNIDEWHFYCFNEDYYIIGYYEAKQWLKNHNIDTFEAIEIVKDYENSNFGEFTTDINSEAIVNMLAYILGEELIYSENFTKVKQLKKAMNNIINE